MSDDLAAARARLDDAAGWLRRDEEDPEYIRLGGAIETLLAAYDTLEATLAAAEAERERAREALTELQECLLRQKDTIDWLQGKRAAAEAERDEWIETANAWHRQHIATNAECERLAALAAAARAWRHHRAIARDPQTEPDAYWANTKHMVQVECDLDDAVRALDAPSADTAPA